MQAIYKKITFYVWDPHCHITAGDRFTIQTHFQKQLDQLDLHVQLHVSTAGAGPVFGETEESSVGPAIDHT